MKLEVIFITPIGTEIIEIMDSANGSTCDYKTRALALNWVVKSVREIE